MDPRLVVVTDDPVNAETPLPLQRGVLTPTALFFMRNRFSIPHLDAETWSLTVDGEVQNVLSLPYEDLLAMPSRTLAVTLECAGNGRSAMHPPAEGEPWSYGAVSTAEWTGVSLSHVLALAGVQDSAREILAEGGDGGTVVAGGEVVPFARSLPLDKALHPDTILAYAMNGEQLPVDHGFPLRLIVPGWYGMASVKWLQTIRAIADPFHGFFQVDRYVMVHDSAPGVQPQPVREIGMRSIILTPQDGETVGDEPRVIRGLAWSGNRPVAAVHVSVDGGETWEAATWTSREEPYAWRAWEYLWFARTVGRAVLMSRATDVDGTHQPHEGQWNRLGYANNAMQRVEVTVESAGDVQ